MECMQGRLAVVTGGASGIGEATVRRFVAAGAHVVIADVQDDRGRRLAQALGPKCAYRHTDVSQAQDMQRLIADTIEQHGRLDCLFNNAGVAGPDLGIAVLNPETWDAMLGLLLRSVYLGMHFSAGWMRRQGHGTIISTAALAGLRAGWGSHVYSAANAAVIQLTRSVAMELGECGVRVNCICPGKIVTTLYGKAMGLSPQEADAALPVLRDAFDGGHPLPRSGTADDVAEAALWLATDQSRFVNGHALVVDGGESCGRGWAVAQREQTKLRAVLAFSTMRNRRESGGTG